MTESEKLEQECKEKIENKICIECPGFQKDCLCRNCVGYNSYYCDFAICGYVEFYDNIAEEIL